MPTSILKSIKGKSVRITRLDECGDVDYGTCAYAAVDCFVSVTVSAEYESGDEYIQKNAWGDLCISDKDPDRIKWCNVSISFAEINPDVLSMITHSNDVVSGGSTIGTTYGPDRNFTSFALEVWTKRANANCTADEYGYFVVPFVRNGKLDGDITIENGTLTLDVMGQGFPAPSTWGVGPYASNPFMTTFPTGDFFGMVVTTVAPEADTAGCATLAP